jgi:molecular chaperone GrpE
MTEKNKCPRVVVGVFIFNDKGELLLTRQPRYNNKFLTIGGGIEYKESYFDTAKREAKEEANIKIDDIEFLRINEVTDLGDSHPLDSKHMISIHLKARTIEYARLKLNKESTEYLWLKPEEWLAKEDLPKNVRDTIENYLLDTNSYENKYKRALADYQNLLRQTAREKSEFARFANEQLIREVIPVYDNLKMAIEHGNGKDHDAWLEGVKYVAKQFKDILESSGVNEIKTEGEKFDHNTMDAVENFETDDKDKDGLVAKELKAGYVLKDKVMIPARVAVYKYAK